MTDRLLSVGEVAAMTTLAESTLYTWRQQNTGPRSHKLHGRVVYRLSDVEAWLEMQERATARGEAVQPKGVPA